MRFEEISRHKITQENNAAIRRGAMALSRRNGTTRVLGRGLPDELIFEGRLTDHHLSGVDTLVSRWSVPNTHDGRAVAGYEDPTFFPRTANPLFPGEEGFTCSQTYARPDGSLACNAVYFSFDALTKPVTLFTPELLARMGLVNSTRSYVKEVEPLDESTVLLEYDDDHARSSIATAVIVATNDGEISVTEVRPSLAAHDDESEHVSTAGAPISHSAYDQRLVGFNRRRDNEWRISFGALAATGAIAPLPGASELRAQPEDGVFFDGQKIMFASSVRWEDSETLEVLSHINDSRCARSLVRVLD